MRTLPIICALAVAMAGCSIPVAPTGKPSVEERSTGGKAGSTLAGKGNLAGGNLVAAGAGNLVAAGAGNLVAAGAGNLTSSKASAGIVAAGAGNVVTANNGGGLVAAGAGNLNQPGAPMPAPNDGGAADNAASNESTITQPSASASTAPSPIPSPSPSPAIVAGAGSPAGGLGILPFAGLIGADGASLVGADGGSLVAPGGGALVAVDTPGPNLPGQEGPEVVIDDTGATTIDVHGTVRAPGALAGRLGALPVGGAKVGLFTLDGTKVVEGTTDATGAYALSGSVPAGLAVVRSTVKVGERTVYLAAVIATADVANALDVDPISTLFEGKYFTALAGESTDAAEAEGASFPAWHASGAPIVDEVTLADVAPATTLAQRAASFDALAAKHPEVGGFVGLAEFLGAM